MFKELHAMAKAATLLMTASAEGDQLRVSVTATYPEGKVPAGATPLRPLSVVGSPDELDADFAAVLAFWQAPKKSLIEQAQAAADEADDSVPGNEGKPAETPPKSKGKPGRKPGAAAAAKPEVAGPADAGAAAGGAGEFALTVVEGQAAAALDAPAAPAAPAAETPPEPEPVASAPVDTFTIDLF
jgi:PRTRC genetic system protein E